MRYGKIYFYDRLGNKVQDDEPVIREEVQHFSINSPRIKVHANTPFDEHQVIPVRSLIDMEQGPMSGHLSTQDLINFDRPALPAELDDISFGPVDNELAYDRGYSIQGDRQLRQRSAFNQVFTPLNDLKDPDDPKNELARQLDKIDLNKLPTVGQYDSGYEDDLCDDCRAVGQHTCGATCGADYHHGLRASDQEDSSRLRSKLREHVDGINWELMHKNRHRELLPMNVLPPFANRPNAADEKILAQQERLRVETEEEKRRKFEREATSPDSRNDAQKYADEQEAQKTLEIINARKDAEFNRMQAEARRRQAREEESKVEWWETRNQINDYKHDRNRQHYTDQLRRNEALRHNVEQLQDFEERFRQQREANHLMRYRQLEHVREKVKEPTELSRPEAARRQRELLESVWQSWADAHRINDRRYKVLQEFDARRHRPLQPSLNVPVPHVECDVKRCRRCRRPITRRVAFAN